ncbi:dihydroorotase family protein [Chloroflexota bacterium]
MAESSTAMPADLVIKGSKIVGGGHITPPSWIVVNNEKITAIGVGQDAPRAKKTIDATGKYVLPGCVDPENHPIPPLERAITTETIAAVVAGITTGGMMQHSPWLGLSTDFKQLYRSADEVPTFMEGFPRFIEMMDKDSYCDYFLTPEMSTEKQVKEIPQLAKELGVTSYKLYLQCKSGEHVWDMWNVMERGGMFYYDDGTVYIAMRSVAELGPPALLCLHCENWEIARVLKQDLIAQGRTDVGAWDDHSPDFCEAGHVRTYAYYAKITGCPIYIIHCTTKKTLDELVRAKADGTDITGQAQVHYMVLDKDAGVINVPLRGKKEHPYLWEGLRTGVLDCVGGDNIWTGIPLEKVERTGKKYPDPVWTKEVDNFTGGNGAVLPILLSEGVNKGRISLERVVEVYCENTAKKFGLYPKKGTISVGSDADFVIVDLDKKKEWTRDMVFSLVGWSVYEGWEITGWPVMTILRGNVLMEWPDNAPRPRIIGKPIGKYIPRKPGYALYPIG